MLHRTASIAERDMVEAALWLNQQKLGAAADFMAAVRREIDTIIAAPFSCTTLLFEGVAFSSQLRWRAVSKFPYVIVFSVENGEILILGVLHNRRDIETILKSRVGTK